jgi:hypothetical protein
VKSLVAIFAIFAASSVVTFGAGWAFGRSPGVVTIVFATLAFLASALIAGLFGLGGSGLSLGEDAWQKPFWLVVGFLPLVTLVAGFFFGRQSA